MVTKSGEVHYPRNGHIVVQVEPERPAKFALKLRVPYWSQKTKIAVNGVESPSQAGTYCVLNREWKPGDRVTIDMDMRLRVWAGEREADGKASLYRGPLLLAHEQPETSARQRPGEWQNFGEVFAARKKGAALEYDFEGEGIKWFGRFYDDAGQSRVLIDGKEIAVVDQYGPVRDQQFAWEYKGLNRGKHTIRIEVSGDKAPESRDTWSNAVGFGPPGANHPSFENGVPVLDLKTANATLVTSATQSTHAFAVVDVTDASGQTLRLRDFATAGQGGVTYSSWLPAKQALITPFSPTNPLRSLAISSQK